MELRGVFAVANEKHIAHQGEESIAQPAVGLLVFALKGLFNLALCVVFGAQLPDVVVQRLQISCLHVVGVFAEHAVENPIADERTGERLFVERQPIGLYLLATHAQRGRELAQQAVYTRYGNFPNAEETQHVVDAVGIKELRHVLETAHPPGAIVAQHLVPVVGWEAPILPFNREIIGRRACLSVEVKVMWFGPHVATVAVYPNGDVAFQYHALSASMLVGMAHLGVKQILNKVMESHLLVSLGRRRREGFAFGFVPSVVVGPLCKVGRAVEVAKVAILGVGHKPITFFFKELLKVLTLHHFLALLLEQLFKISCFGVVHAFVINLRQRVKLLPQGLESHAFVFFLQQRQCIEVYILRMKGENADATVWIRVGPGVRCGAVVDGQHLQHALVGMRHEVYHGFKVAKVAHAKAAFGAQREHGHKGSGKAFVPKFEESLVQLVHANLVLANLRQLQLAVITRLPKRCNAAIGINGHKLHGNFFAFQFVEIEVYGPFAIAHLGHGQGSAKCPRAKCHVVAH